MSMRYWGVHSMWNSLKFRLIIFQLINDQLAYIVLLSLVNKNKVFTITIGSEIIQALFFSRSQIIIDSQFVGFVEINERVVDVPGFINILCVGRL